MTTHNHVVADSQSEIARLKLELSESEELCNQWRALAHQFDHHRLQTAICLKSVVNGMEGAVERSRDFLKRPPVSGQSLVEREEKLLRVLEDVIEDYKALRERFNDDHRYGGEWKDDGLEARAAEIINQVKEGIPS